MRKFGHFLISLLLLKIFTETQEQLSTIKRGIHTSREGKPPIFFCLSYVPFWTEFSKCSYSRVLAPACGALVKIPYSS